MNPCEHVGEGGADQDKWDVYVSASKLEQETRAYLELAEASGEITIHPRARLGDDWLPF